MSISGSGASRISPVSGSTVGCSSVAAISSCSSSSGGIFSSQTLKSPDSRPIWTLAYGAEPGVFLYADSSASSSASISFSWEMFFSAARPRTASTISLLIACSVSRYEVGAGDLLVRDRDEPVRGGERDVCVARAHQLAGQLLVPIRGVAQAHARAPAEKAAVVLRLGQRAILTGRGDLQRVALAVVAEVPGDPLAERQRHAVRVVDEDAQDGALHLREQQLNLRLEAGQSGFDFGLGCTHDLLRHMS